MCFVLINFSLLFCHVKRDLSWNFIPFSKCFSSSTMAANTNANAANLNVLANVATPSPLHDALGHMGFVQAIINYMTVDQDMNSLAEFQILTDNELKLLCKFLCQHGVTTGNPLPLIPAFQCWSVLRWTSCWCVTPWDLGRGQALLLWQPASPLMQWGQWKLIANRRKATKMWTPQIFCKGLAPYDQGHRRMVAWKPRCVKDTFGLCHQTGPRNWSSLRLRIHIWCMHL